MSVTNGKSTVLLYRPEAIEKQAMRAYAPARCSAGNLLTFQRNTHFVAGGAARGSAGNLLMFKGTQILWREVFTIRGVRNKRCS